MRYGLVCLLFLLALTGCSKKDKEIVWGTYQEPVVPGAYPQDSGARELTRLWQKDIGAGARSGYALLNPGYHEGAVFVASREGEVYRLNADSGKTVWKSELGGAVFSGVGIGNGRVVVTMDNGNVVAMDQADGSVVWTTPIKRQFSAIPVVGQSRVVVRSADGLIIGLDAESGNIMWQLERFSPTLIMHGDSTPTISGDTVLTGLSNGMLLANNVITGREYWEVQITSIVGENELEQLMDVDTSPLTDGNTVYTATYQGHVVSIDMLDVQVHWRTKISTRLSMTLDRDRLYLTDELGSIAALEREDGQFAWMQKAFQGRGVSFPIVIKDRVVIGDNTGRIHTLDKGDGTLIESRKAVSGAVVSMTTQDDHLIVFSAEGHIARYSL